MIRKLSVLTVVLAIGGAVAGVALAASSPSAATGPATNIQDQSAVIRAVVNPNGSPTDVQFLWGLTTAYGYASGLHPIGRGSDPVPVAASATGLVPGTVYHYVVIATNRFGQTVGSDRAFTTAGHPPPGVVTGVATQITTNAATLTGVVNPNGEATTWLFQYGITPALGMQTFGVAMAAGSAPEAVAVQLTGLAPGTTFYYRLVAFHDTTIFSYGLESTFLSEPSPRPVPTVHAHTTRSRVAPKRFLFTTNGTVSLPGSIPALYGCAGTATIRYLLGPRQYTSTIAAVQPNCAFSGQVLLRRRRNGPVILLVRVHFNGNGYLAPRRARPQGVLLP
jgi:hypothetical protein